MSGTKQKDVRPSHLECSHANRITQIHLEYSESDRRERGMCTSVKREKDGKRDRRRKESREEEEKKRECVEN